MNKINWTLKAAKQLRRLDKQFQKPIVDAVQTLEAMPNCQNVKQLVNHQYD